MLYFYSAEIPITVISQTWSTYDIIPQELLSVFVIGFIHAMRGNNGAFGGKGDMVLNIVLCV